MSREQDIKRWIVGIIDTGCADDIVVGSLCDEGHVFYDERLKELYPDITEEEIISAKNSLVEEGLIRDNNGMLFVNWKKWQEEVGSIPWIGLPSEYEKVEE
jgi:hypothetical protein